VARTFVVVGGYSEVHDTIDAAEKHGEVGRAVLYHKPVDGVRGAVEIRKPAFLEAVEEGKYEALGRGVGALVDDKRRQYGDSAERVGRMMEVLYPNGVPRHAYGDALLIVRTLDKLCRIANRDEDNRDLGGESPWTDVSGYALIGQGREAK